MAKVTPERGTLAASTLPAAGAATIGGGSAYKVMQISLASRLGNVALSIKAAVRNDRIQKAAELAALHLLFHSAGSKAFSGKDGGHKRDEAFSSELAADVSSAAEAALGAVFEKIEIATSPYARLSRVERLAREMEELGIDAETIAKVRKQDAPAVAKTEDESLG